MPKLGQNVGTKVDKITALDTRISTILNGFLLAEFPTWSYWPRNLFFRFGLRSSLLRKTFPKKGQKKSCAMMAEKCKTPQEWFCTASLTWRWAWGEMSVMSCHYSNYKFKMTMGAGNAFPTKHPVVLSTYAGNNTTQQKYKYTLIGLWRFDRASFTSCCIGLSHLRLAQLSAQQ